MSTARTYNLDELKTWRYPKRKRCAPRRKPGCGGGEYVAYWAGNFLAANRVERGSIIFPSVAEGYSPLCVELLERACAFILELGERYHVRHYGGPVPGLNRSDLLQAASDLLSEADDDAIPAAGILDAVAEAWRYIGFEN